MGADKRFEIGDLLLRSIRMTNWIGILGVGLLSWFIVREPEERFFIVVFSLAAGIFNHFIFQHLLARGDLFGRYPYLAGTGAVLIITGYFLLLAPYGFRLEILYIVIICCVGILAGSTAAFLAALLAVLIYLVSLTKTPIFAFENLPYLGLHILIMVLAGYWMSILAGAIHRNLLLSSRRNQYFSLLLKVGTLVSQREDLNIILTKTCETIAKDIPVTTCAILLAEEGKQKLRVYGASPLRSLPIQNEMTGECLDIRWHPQIDRLFKRGAYLVLDETALAAPESADLVDCFAFSWIKTLGLFPLVTKGTSLGLIAVAESRNWRREPFTGEKIGLLQTLSTQIAAAIENARLFEAAQNQAQRLAVLNEVGKAIGSTLDMNALLELIYEQLNLVISCESYFVSLYDEAESIQDFRILIDDGERFPPRRVPMREGFASWVIHNRRPLLIRNLDNELDSLPVRPIILGLDKMSQSWMGVPMLVGDRVLGILAVASYAKYAFDEDDLDLLTSIAAQASLALDNARQHAEVKEQATRDSLTGALNHGAFLTLLAETVLAAETGQIPVSLIMLDIDYFKDYNDQYGHLVGDEVLKRLVEEIQAALPEEAFIGRWGGEEFAIGLPGMHLDQAAGIAHQIRSSEIQVELKDKNGNRLPNPTISQGVATYPDHAQTSSQLIDIADMALYQAKDAGRNQVIGAAGKDK
jgi:diguanylate cyclase (GGDEF)-like protein